MIPIPVQVLIALGMYRRKQHLKYPAFWSYLWFSAAALTLTVLVARTSAAHAYFLIYWGSQFFTTIFILAVLREVFVKLLADYSFLTSFQRRGYEFALAAACLTAVLTATRINSHSVFAEEIQLQQSVSLVAVIMLIFVGAASVALGIRWRTELCGIAVGVGLQGIADVLVFTTSLRHGAYNPMLIGWVERITYDFSFAVFALYFLVPQEESATPPVRKELTEWVESMSETLPR
jgi:hypothetical protein